MSVNIQNETFKMLPFITFASIREQSQADSLPFCVHQLEKESRHILFAVLIIGRLYV